MLDRPSTYYQNYSGVQPIKGQHSHFGGIAYVYHQV